MKRLPKILAWTLIALTILVAIGLGAIALLVDPNDFKPLIVRTLYEKKQRTLAFSGPIKLRVFPQIALDLGRVSLSEYRSHDVFVTVNRAKLGVAWLPLLRRRLVVNGLELEGVQARVIRYHDGRFNFADLLQPETRTQIDFDIASAAVRGGVVIFDDYKAARRFVFDQVEIETGRLMNRRETGVQATGRVRAARPAMSLALAADSRLYFDTRRRVYQLRNFDLTARGSAFGLSELVSRVAADEVSFAPQARQGKRIRMTAEGKRGDWRTRTEASLGAWRWAADTLAFERPAAMLTLERAATRVELSARSERLAQAQRVWRSGRIDYDIGMTFANATVRGKAHSGLAVLEGRVGLPDLQAVLGVSGPRWAKGGFRLNVGGNIELAPAPKPAFKGRFDARAHNTRARIAIEQRTRNPMIFGFDAKLDRLDLDRFVAKAQRSDKQAQQPWKIPDPKSTGTIQIGELTRGTTKAYDVTIEFTRD